MYIIEMNPAAIIISFDKENMKIVIEKTQLNLSGELIMKYFVNHWEYYVSPISSIEVFRIISSKNVSNNACDFDDFHKVIVLLINKKVLIKHRNTVINELVKIKVKVIDYTNQKMGKFIESFINQSIKHQNSNSTMFEYDYTEVIGSNYNRDESVEISNEEPNTMLLEIVIPLFWRVSIEEIDKIFKHKGKNTIILPVICNYCYFSIGPQIKDANSKENGLRTLIEEMPRYLYVNPNPEDGYTGIMASHLYQQLQYICEELLTGVVRTRTDGEIITYNFTSYTMEINKYYCI